MHDNKIALVQRESLIVGIIANCIAFVFSLHAIRFTRSEVGKQQGSLMVLTVQTSSEAFSSDERKQTEQDSANGSSAGRLGFVLQRAVKLSHGSRRPSCLNAPALVQQCGKCS